MKDLSYEWTSFHSHCRVTLSLSQASTHIRSTSYSSIPLPSRFSPYE